MGSTFGILETAKRGMFTQQQAISTTTHNISNSNNSYYTRQRVNMSATSPYPTPGFNQPYMAGQLGTGVTVSSIQRIREDFLDVQFRGENNKFAYYRAKAESLSKMEDIMNEPSDTGLAKTVDRFWQSLQDVATSPENSGAKSVVLERAKAVADTFNYLTDSLKANQNDLKSQIDNSVNTINSYLTQLQAINKQIASVEPHGSVPNDLYDERDKLLDQLSEHMNIQVTYESSGGLASPVAQGKATIKLLDSNGVPMDPPLLNGMNVDEPPTKVSLATNATGDITGVKIGGKEIAVSNMSNGTLKGLVESHGYHDGTKVVGDYPEMIQNLTSIAQSFVDKLTVPSKDPVTGDPTTTSMFTVGADGRVTVNQTAIKDFLDTATPADVKAWAQETADAINDTAGVNFNQTYQKIIGEMGVKSQEAVRLANNSKTLTLTADNNRKSVSAVSVDEELTNLVTFQHAYNASARMISAIDEMLDTIVNKMGLVGR